MTPCEGVKEPLCTVPYKDEKDWLIWGSAQDVSLTYG